MNVTLPFRRDLALLLGLVVSAFGCGSIDGAEQSEAPGAAQSALTLDNQPGTSSPWLYDAGTDCRSVYGILGELGSGGQYPPVNTHCCPPGMAMTGAHIASNTFKCAPIHGGLSHAYLDWGSCAGLFGATCTQRNGMHACKQGTVMVGVNVGINQLICAQPSEGVQFEYVDGGTQDGFMHVCARGSDEPVPVRDERHSRRGKQVYLRPLTQAEQSPRRHDAFRLLLRYVQGRARKPRATLTLAELDAPVLLALLEHLERDRLTETGGRPVRAVVPREIRAAAQLYGVPEGLLRAVVAPPGRLNAKDRRQVHLAGRCRRRRARRDQDAE